MVRRARFRSKAFGGILFLLVACNSGEDLPLFSVIDSSLTSVNGIVFRSGQRFTGKTFAFFPSSLDTMEISQFRNGVENGMWVKRYEGGKRREQRSFRDGKKTGVMYAWWENGGKRLEYHFVNDEYEGICREWNQDGKLVREMSYVNGHEEGSQKVFYDNGKIRSNYVVKNGRRYGLLGTKNCVNVTDSVFKN